MRSLQQRSNQQYTWGRSMGGKKDDEQKKRHELNPSTTLYLAERRQTPREKNASQVYIRLYVCVKAT
jgi:hypothetical protein